MTKLNNEERRRLREAMLSSFANLDRLDIFVQDHLDVVLNHKVKTDAALEVVFQSFIRWADEAGQVTKFLQAALGDANLPHLRAIAEELVAKAGAAAASGNGQGKPFVVRNRPVLDRESLWHRLTALGGPGANRVLVVNGEVGKSHSVWMLTYLCDSSIGTAQLKTVDARDAEVPVTPGSLARLIATRVWNEAGVAGPDPYAQDARDSRKLATLLIGKLSALQEPTWVVIDELDQVNLEPETLDLLTRLSKETDAGQCPNVWLFLIGLDPNRLGAQVGQFLPVDVVKRPQKTDIESYVSWFARSVNNGDQATIATVVNELDAVLQHTPSYAEWEAFHKLLQLRCRDLAGGVHA
ncbi:MAG TPA: effector-associated domain EAD1-containing protein [Myxococcaceae bacterium]|nr:effector-associated domain EAD1-containing protein [Myxococcaceae bacterium]